MTTTIPWGDGSGDNIYLNYSASTGDQTIAVSSDANGGSVARTKVITFSASGVPSVTLTVIQAAQSVNLVVITRNDVYPTYDDTAVGYRPTVKVVSGEGSVVLDGAAADAIIYLKQYGKCAQASTPSPSSPVDIVCNNGAIKYGIPLTLNATRLKAYIRDGGLWVNSSDSYSIVVPVTIGKKYAIRLTNTASGTVGTIFRYGFSTRNTAGDTTTNLVQLTQWVRSTPQDISFVELVADNPYLIIQMGASSFSTVISNGYIVVTEQTLYIDGTPEVQTLGQQTASVADLLQAGDFMDEQDIVTGVVTRRLGVKVLDGTEIWRDTSSGGCFYAIISTMKKNNPRITGFSTHFVGTSAANTNMPDNAMAYAYSGDYGIVVVKCTACADVTAFKTFLEQQYAAGTPVIIVFPLATPTTEQVTPQPLNAASGNNTVTATAEVANVPLEVKYKLAL